MQSLLQKIGTTSGGKKQGSYRSAFLKKYPN